MKITLDHNGQLIEANDSDSLFTQLKAAGFNIKSTCGGCASCGQCVVVIKEGEHNLEPIKFEEKQLLGNVFHITKERLSCQTFLNGDITVDIGAHLELNQFNQINQNEQKVKVVRRSKEQAQQVLDERKQKAKEKKENAPKRLGGGKKPKAFSFKEDEDQNVNNPKIHSEDTTKSETK